MASLLRTELALTKSTTSLGSKFGSNLGNMGSKLSNGLGTITNMLPSFLAKGASLASSSMMEIFALAGGLGIFLLSKALS